MPTWSVAFISVCGVLFVLIVAFTARAIYRHLSQALYSPPRSEGVCVTQPPPSLRAVCTPHSAAPLSDDKIDMVAPRCDKPPRRSCVCSICLDVIQRAQSARVIASCGHIFHSSCVKSWLRRSNECPSCQREALLEETVKHLLDLHAKRAHAHARPSIADRLRRSGSFASHGAPAAAAPPPPPPTPSRR